MNITMLIESLESGGAQRQLCTLAVEMKRRGHCVQLATYAPATFYRPMLQEAGVRHMFLGGNGTREWVSKIRNFLRHENHDVVLAFLQSTAAYAELSALPSRPWGLVVSERLALPGLGNGVSRFKKYFHLIADAVTTNSHTARLMLEAAVPMLGERMVTIYNAVDLDKFRPTLDFHHHKDLRLIVAARISNQKNLPGTIDAIAKLRRKKSIGVSVDWFGITSNDPVLWHQCQKRIEALGLAECFRIHPPVRDIISAYRQADAVLLPSFYEGLPNTICEAMACGKPVLMSAVCDAGGLVKEGENGFLFSPLDPDDMANTIEKFTCLTEAQRHAMGEAGRQMAEIYFNVVKIGDLYESVLLSAQMRQHPSTGHWLPEVPWTATKYLRGRD
ncbi:MAG: glycosyltransferase family 4 protein [Syntrophobacteraceae bacterium]